ncbi:BMC domain-containing protein [Egibacter rhizosphaerae]|uniref:BMC domain-containing protein n=1 Tax=Egibacter rhizosphaerae TaxID=1670831 RepID=A0A411YBN1_9ACTN|nr:BMC domain-containing protein [Egibacter rhizosphaerae]QBI18614.1 BMC domain-containing protein [Egibacter rhizosphaerae]
MEPSVAVCELDSVARGIAAADAMVKRSPLDVMRAGTVHPGKYLVLLAGETADVEEALEAGQEAAGAAMVGLVFLPDVHEDVVAAIQGVRRPAHEALGVIETGTVASAIESADAAVKGAEVVLRELRLADDLGGKAYVLLGGTVSEVQAGVDIGTARVPAGDLIEHVVIAQLHEETDQNLTADARFAPRIPGRVD